MGYNGDPSPTKRSTVMFDRFMDLVKQNKEIEAEQSRRRSRNRAIFFGAVGALGLAWFSKNLAKNTITLMED